MRAGMLAHAPTRACARFASSARRPRRYKQIGIDPPRGVLLYGPPGTGKTMLAKAVAAHTTASFIRVVGSEFVQK